MYTEFLNEIYQIKIADEEGVFKYRVGQTLSAAGVEITRIEWLHNLLNQFGLIRYQIFAKNKDGEEFAWLTLDKGTYTTITITQKK